MLCVAACSPPLPASAASSWRACRKACPRLVCRRHISPERDAGPSDEEEGEGGEARKPRTLLVERYADGTAKRYLLDKQSQLLIVTEAHQSSINVTQKENHSTDLSWLPSFLKDFILPAGYPGSVSNDYVDYMLLQFPTNVSGWVCHTLVTSSLLKAVGVGSFEGSSAAASAAAIRWVSKDGLGAVGRLLIGGRFGNIFDDDPKQWRLYADFIGSAGSIFELCTPLYPAYFLPLASLGNFAKAIARGLKDPSFRVIQNHFAVSANLGEVAAKEEVWEVTAQLMGLALGILIMEIPGFQTSYSTLVCTWLGVRVLHLWLRYLSLSVLKFHTINLKRARILARAHVVRHKVPGYVDCNKQEDIFSIEQFLRPRITFGASVEAMIGKRGHVMKALLELFRNEMYVLFVKRYQSRELEFFVTFKVGATSMSVLRCLWQVYWLHENQERLPDNFSCWLEESLVRLENDFIGFLNELEQAGWDMHRINLKVPKELLLDDGPGEQYTL